MQKVKANSSVISSVIHVLIACFLASITDCEARCIDCQPADPDAKRNVVSSQNSSLLPWTYEIVFHHFACVFLSHYIQRVISLLNVDVAILLILSVYSCI